MSENIEDQKAFEQTQKELAEIGATPAPVDESTKEEEKVDDTEEKSETEEVEEESTEETEESETEEVEESEEETEEETDEETEEETESDEDEETPPKAISPKAFKEFKKNLRAELESDYEKKLEAFKKESQKENPNKKTEDSLESDIQALAKELNFDPEKVKKIIAISRKGLEATEEDKQFVAEQKKFFEAEKQKAFMREQEAIFNGEWGQVLPQVKSMFPNASDEQIAKVKAEVDKLSHTEKYHKTDLDYILFKEKSRFEKLAFSPKQKTFESGKPQARTEEEFDFEKPVDVSDMTPAQFELYEKRREAAMEAAPREKLTIKTRDDRGRLVEREE